MSRTYVDDSKEWINQLAYERRPDLYNEDDHSYRLEDARLLLACDVLLWVLAPAIIVTIGILIGLAV